MNKFRNILKYPIPKQVLGMGIGKRTIFKYSADALHGTTDR